MEGALSNLKGQNNQLAVNYLLSIDDSVAFS